MSEMILEQYQCETCGRLFYINKGDKSSLDVYYGCPYGCDDAGRHIRTLTVMVVEKQEVKNGGRHRI